MTMDRMNDDIRRQLAAADAYRNALVQIAAGEGDPKEIATDVLTVGGRDDSRRSAAIRRWASRGRLISQVDPAERMRRANAAMDDARGRLA